jgi:RNA polymerase sigma-70 factor, ECF subfamily
MTDATRTTMAAPDDAEDIDVPVVQATPLFEVFYRTEFDAVAGLAYALSGSRLGSEDLAQEAFLAAYRRWDEIGRYDNPGAWVRRVVANRSVSVIRRRVVETKALPKLVRSDELLPELSPESSDVWREVRRLPKRQAHVVALYYLEDLALEDVGNILELSVETVRTHLRRARKTLARRLTVVEETHDS